MNDFTAENANGEFKSGFETKEAAWDYIADNLCSACKKNFQARGLKSITQVIQCAARNGMFFPTSELKAAINISEMIRVAEETSIYKRAWFSL